MTRPTRLLTIIALLVATSIACRMGGGAEPIIPTATPKPTATPLPEIVAPVPVETEEAVVEEEPGVLGPYGPEEYPDDVNPLTGLPIEGTEEEIRDVVERRPVYVKISNHPPSYVVPQSGLQTADHVWEHQVEGFSLTRFSAIFLTESPELVGPVRSGRHPDLELVPMYQALYVASGFSTNSGNEDEPPRMRELMLQANWRPQNFSYEFGVGAPYTERVDRGPEIPTEHTLFTYPDRLWELADEREVNGQSSIGGLAFYSEVPEGGTVTEEVVIDYPGPGAKAEWRWNEELERWQRWQNDDPHEDRLTEEQLAFDNVVIIGAVHEETDFPEDFATGIRGVAINLYGQGDVIILRDGQRYEGTWRRSESQAREMLQFTTENGEPMYLKPGNVWFQSISIGFGGPLVYYDGEIPEDEGG